MNEPTEQELKIGLAKLLYDKIHISEAAQKGCYNFFWYNDSVIVNEHKDFLPQIRDTEWLHIVHLIEETFVHKFGEQQAMYLIALRDVVYSTKHSGIPIELAMTHATWQERAKAILKIKGRE